MSDPSRFVAIAAATAVTMSASTVSQPSLVKSEFIYKAASFPECHASTITESNRDLVAACFSGTHEGHPDVGIWLSHHEKCKWTPPVEVATGQQSATKRYPCWNPVLFPPTDGPLLVFYKAGPSPGSWWGMLMSSAENCRTWSTPRRLPEGILGPIKNKPVQLANGDLRCPSSSETHGWRAHFERTPDWGQTWQAAEPVNDGREIDAIQPSILLHQAGLLQALRRTRQGRNFQVWYNDNGKTWGKMTLTSSPNPNSGSDAVTLKDGRRLLVYNHTTKGRSPLNVVLSTKGKDRQASLIMESEAGEYSYSAVIQTSDGAAHITYIWKRQRVKHVAVGPTKLEAHAIAGAHWPTF